MGAIADRATLTELAAVAEPTRLEMLSPAQLEELQAALSILGYPAGGIDGRIGPRTRNAWAEYKSDIFPGHPELIGKESIERLRQDLLKVAAWETANFGSKQGTIDAVKGMCRTLGIGLPTQIAYVLATTQWETAQTFQPVKEAFWNSEAWREANLSYYPYYGRGYVQLTWDRNYKAYTDILDIDLVGNPNRALDPPISLFVLVHGFKTGTFTGRKITDFINQNITDFIGARRCINGTDRAGEIAALAEKFMAVAAPLPSGPPPTPVMAPPTPPAPPAGSGGMGMDPDIEKLSLRPVARAAAYELKRLHPQVMFTSGRRDKVAQARAMSQNVVQQRDWIRMTYAVNNVSMACQAWVDAHPEATSVSAIEAGLLSVFNAMDDAELGRFSLHMSGNAFDLQPMEPDIAGIKATIPTLPGFKKFLEREGNLVRWHAEFIG